MTDKEFIGEMTDKEFMGEIFKIAFGYGASNRGFTREEVVKKIRQYSNRSTNEEIEYG